MNSGYVLHFRNSDLTFDIYILVKNESLASDKKRGLSIREIGGSRDKDLESEPEKSALLFSEKRKKIPLCFQ